MSRGIFEQHHDIDQVRFIARAFARNPPSIRLPKGAPERLTLLVAERELRDWRLQFRPVRTVNIAFGEKYWIDLREKSAVRAFELAATQAEFERLALARAQDLVDGKHKAHLWVVTDCLRFLFPV